MADYRLIGIGVQRASDSAMIPADGRNRDWRKYQEWLSAGHTPDPMIDPQEPQETNTECVNRRLRNDPLFVALLKRMAAVEGITVAEVRDSLLAEVEQRAGP